MIPLLPPDKYRPSGSAIGAPFIIVHDLVNSETGLTYREENLLIIHKIPVGSLVEVKFDDWFGEGACWKVHARLWVVAHQRDCDGTPLYTLSRWNDYEFARSIQACFGGFAEKSLKVIEITEAIKQGEGALEYPIEDTP